MVDLRMIVIRLLVIAVMAMIMAVLSACDKHEREPEAIRVTKLLTSVTWEIQRVTADGVDVTGSYANLTVQFTDASFTSTNGEPVWPASGTWTFADNTAKVIVRDEDVAMTIETITNTELVLTLPWDHSTFGPGRARSVEGNYRFEFVAK